MSNNEELKPKSTALRRQREREARRRLILDAAKVVFADGSFLGATVEEIAEEAALAVGTLYRYFQSKEEMYVSLLFEAMDMFQDYIEAIRAEDIPPDRQLRAVWRFFYDFYNEQPEYYRVFMFLHNEGLRDLISEDVLREINNRAGKNFWLVGQIFEEGVKAGIFRSVDKRIVVDTLWSLLIGLVQLTETRLNLSTTGSVSLETLHDTSYQWIENGLRKEKPDVKLNHKI